jgi:hypothetical protein
MGHAGTGEYFPLLVVCMEQLALAVGQAADLARPAFLTPEAMLESRP